MSVAKHGSGLLVRVDDSLTQVGRADPSAYLAASATTRRARTLVLPVGALRGLDGAILLGAAVAFYVLPGVLDNAVYALRAGSALVLDTAATAH